MLVFCSRVSVCASFGLEVRVCACFALGVSVCACFAFGVSVCVLVLLSGGESRLDFLSG